ncbi:hypothetical protein Naga_100409g7 [Nannochloropsis gaditana]|uniref:Uncharacterized protein n=1 Tax=Nannochloropsis gaditana TaxID=72520 RepID=W7TSP6_9STRA|nr:hypothetical protein Naga_100409g7 [Nannochloropsis gaditana]
MEHGGMVHTGDAMSPPPPCRHCFWGHVMPGSYLLFRAFLLLLEALSIQQPGRFRPRTQARLRAYSSLLAGPLLALGEGLTHKAWHGANVQHFSIYSLIFLDGLVSWYCLLSHPERGRKGRGWPVALLGVWEGGVSACVGYQMVSHFHGGILITSMHALMSPLLTLVGTLLLVDRVLMGREGGQRREGVKLAAAVGMAWVGCWAGWRGTR